jgi:hypothetical protein
MPHMRPEVLVSEPNGRSRLTATTETGFTLETHTLENTDTLFWKPVWTVLDGNLGNLLKPT